MIRNIREFGTNIVGAWRMKKVFLVFALVLVLLISAGAQNLTRHLIEIDVDRGGYAKVTEIYSLDFTDKNSLGNFLKNVAENGPSLDAWRSDYSWLFPHFGSMTRISAYITFDDRERAVILNYSIDDKFAKLESESARTANWRILDSRFSNFAKGGIIIIPKSTEIKIVLPVGARIDEAKLTSHAKRIEDAIVLSGISTTYINLQYVLEKPIAPPLDLSQLIRQFMASELNLVFVAIVAILIALAIWKRRPIAQRIENYIVEHSSIESKRQEEEVELEE